MNQYIQIKEKLLDVFKDRNIESSFDELNENEYRIIDFNREKHPYKGRAFVLQYEDKKVFGIIKFNSKPQLRIDFTENEIDKYFQIINEKQTGFLPVDGKGTITDNNQSCCDFVFFNHHTFYFCEFKVFATTESYLSIKQKREEATQQLVNTIKLFDEKLNANYCNLILQSYLISPPHFPKFNPDIQQLKISFLEKNGIELNEIYSK